MRVQKHLRILFIGNSHTYFAELAAMVSDLAEMEGFSCDARMIAQGGWFLAQHVK